MTTTGYLLDIHAVLVRRLRAYTPLTDVVGQRIYARHYPERVTLPACRVVVPAHTGAAIPSPAWWYYTGQVDCHGNKHEEAFQVAQLVQSGLLSLESSDDPDAVFAAVDPFGVQTGFDGEWTPPKPRWIVAVTLTARTRQEE